MANTIIPMQEPRVVDRAELFQRMRRHRAEVEQIFIDVEHWNRIHPDEEPLDPDPDGTMRRIADAYDKALAIEDARA